MASTTPLGKVLGSSEALARLRDHAQRLARLQRAVDAALPPAIQGRAQVANLVEGRLTLHVQSPAMATRLKLGLETLQERLRTAGEPIAEIKVKVRTSTLPMAGHTMHDSSRRIGERGRESLRTLGDSLQPDDPLAQALRRMIDRSA